MQLYDFLVKLLGETDAAPTLSLYIDQAGETGGIELEWYKGPRKTLSLTLEPSAYVVWAMLLGDKSVGGEFAMDDWKDARPVVAALKKWEAA